MTADRRRVPVVPVLYVVALLLACACVAGGVLVLREHDDRADEIAAAERYGEVKKAAENTAEAMVNIDYRDTQKSIDAVGAASTGEFAEQWGGVATDLTRLVEDAEATLTSTVSSVAVSSLDGDSATVLVTTDGTVTNNQTGSKPQARYFRFMFDLARVDGVWLASSLEIVG